MGFGLRVLQEPHEVQGQNGRRGGLHLSMVSALGMCMIVHHIAFPAPHFLNPASAKEYLEARRGLYRANALRSFIRSSSMFVAVVVSTADVVEHFHTLAARPYKAS